MLARCRPVRRARAALSRASSAQARSGCVRGPIPRSDLDLWPAEQPGAALHNAHAQLQPARACEKQNAGGRARGVRRLDGAADGPFRPLVDRAELARAPVRKHVARTVPASPSRKREPGPRWRRHDRDRCRQSPASRCAGVSNDALRLAQRGGDVTPHARQDRGHGRTARPSPAPPQRGRCGRRRYGRGSDRCSSAPARDPRRHRSGGHRARTGRAAAVEGFEGRGPSARTVTGHAGPPHPQTPQSARSARLCAVYRGG